MAESLRSTVRFHGDDITITDVHCCPHDGGCGAEEYATQDEFVLPRRGMFVRHLGRQATLADANTVIFFRSGETYRVSHPAAGGDDCTVFTPGAALLHELLADSGAHAGALGLDRSAGHRTAEVTLRLQTLRRDLQQLPLDTLKVEQAAVELLGTLLGTAAPGGRTSRARRTSTRAAHGRAVDTVREFLAARFATAVSLGELARVAHTSRFHLTRVFRDATGASIHAYQRELRLAAALERLAGGERDLLRLALDLGFSSHSHFTTVFRRRFGFPPVQFRSSPLAVNPAEVRTIVKAGPTC